MVTLSTDREYFCLQYWGHARSADGWILSLESPSRQKCIWARSPLFFFDPNFNAELHSISIKDAIADNGEYERWDNANIHKFQGTYGDYVLNKVAKVFPELFPNFSRTVSKSIVNKPLSLGVKPQTLSLNGLTPIPSPKKEAEGFQEKSDGNPIGAQAVR